MRIKTSKLPRGQEQIFKIDSTYVIRIDSDLAHRSDKIISKIFGRDDVQMDFIYNNLNNTSSLRIKPNTTYEIVTDEFINDFGN